MINLNKNENLYGPAPSCIELLKNPPLELFTSYPRELVSPLKYSLSKYFNIDSSKIILGYGAEDILRHLFYHFIRKNDNILLSDKSWYYYDNLSNFVNAKTNYYNTLKKEYCFEIDFDSVMHNEKKLDSKLLVFCSPDNPTGATINYENIEEVLKVKKDGLVLLDEAYWGFCENSDEYIAKLIDKYDNFCVLRTFSKYFALAGIRIGYAFCSGKVKEMLNHHERLLGFNRLSEYICAEALKSNDYYKKINKNISTDRDLTIKEINKLDGFKAYASCANFFLADIPENKKEILQNNLENKEIIIKFLTESGFENSARISIGKQEHTKLLIEAFKETTG